MVIIETPVFTRRVLNILSDDEYRDLQTFLTASPAAGDIIPGSNGLRKLRWRYVAHAVLIQKERTEWAYCGSIEET